MHLTKTTLYLSMLSSVLASPYCFIDTGAGIGYCHGDDGSNYPCWPHYPCKTPGKPNGCKQQINSQGVAGATCNLA
ncbi:unnamed protein product [Zymoseptoria tritici ST99CH_1A5]|uniref:CBM1 domain-containing protein n=3 Tax=Zymoseptoria tritici TaxID=1047171 RepID=A0A1X7RY72_ZYMT9|nr:unnamed protein product [Zymoseptoria tritici ST99CH_3D7]SMR55196.1 unnamed protein product [Zymoseptoria tritici ST99CH_1E4]SMR57571.1 unnamed protein product [Zymoseptoria tritici ST99CH_3D1]SMY26007.1 unnamed protein product [Zymoseptoria tritici ST99CH_1A5]